MTRSNAKVLSNNQIFIAYIGFFGLDRRIPKTTLNKANPTNAVIPAKAGIQIKKPMNYDRLQSFVGFEYSRRKSRRIWIPAYAGMTENEGLKRDRRFLECVGLGLDSRLPSRFALPAEATLKSRE
jgi:hypothetical protein